MEVIICSSPDEVARVAAGRIVQALAVRDEPVLGLSTGSSPLRIYHDLRRRIEAGELDLSHAHAFALDEYAGLPPDHPQSYFQTIRRTVTEPLRLAPDRVHVPDGMADDVLAACAAYEESIRWVGGIDVQILGIGANGHIGFNEPGSSFGSRTRLKTLASRTRADNERFFTAGPHSGGPDDHRPDDHPDDGEPGADGVPTHCITQGLGTIMDARRLVLVAMGEHKAEAIARTVEGPVQAMCPASILQFHPQASVVVDEAAASKLLTTEYHRDTWRQLPDWQRPPL